MGKRGPQPKAEEKKQEALALLDSEASTWANLLLELREGKDGWCAEVRWGRPEGTKGMGKFWRGQTLGATRIPLDAAILPRGMRKQALRKYQRKEEGWQYIPPIWPQREIWEAVKNAQTVRQIHAAAKRFKRWISRSPSGYTIVQGRKLRLERHRAYRDYWRVLHDRANEILAAKRLWTYPRANRPKSDDKRIEFFSKSLAGLMFGLAPATAQRRLTGWHWLTGKRAPMKMAKQVQAQFFERFRKQRNGG